MTHSRINLKTVKRTSHVCPSQWEGLLKDGRPFYARFRMNHFQFWIAKEEYQGYMSGSEFLTILHKYSLVDYYSCVIMYLRVKEFLERLFYRVKNVYFKGNTDS